MLRLGVNIDHVATLRQARYAGEVRPWAEPDVLAAAREVQAARAHSITVHLREDRRHIQDSDVRLLKEKIHLDLNLEMANVPEIVRIALKIRPEEICLVPERRQEVTTEGGLNVKGQLQSLQKTIARLESAGIRTSLFIDPDLQQIEAAGLSGASCIELHTGCFANARTASARKRELAKLKLAAACGCELGLQVNAGHGLNYQNVRTMLEIPELHTLNIGHSIISRAVFVGLRRAVSEMLKLIR